MIGSWRISKYHAIDEIRALSNGIYLLKRHSPGYHSPFKDTMIKGKPSLIEREKESNLSSTRMQGPG